MSNEQYIERGAQVADEARRRLRRLHPKMTKAQLEDAVHATELAYLSAIKDVFTEIAEMAKDQASPHGTN